MIEIVKSKKDPNKPAWWWIGGDTRPHKELFKEHGAKWSRKRKQWYLISETLPQAIQNLADSLNPEGNSSPDRETIKVEVPNVDEHPPCSIEEASQVLSIPLSRNSSYETRSKEIMKVREEEERPNQDAEAEMVEPIRVLAAPEADELIKETMLQLKASPSALVIEPAPVRTSRQKIPQRYCGELTGSITGAVWCYGYALHEGICIYLNMAGPKMATEAIRAKLGKGDIVNLLPEDASAIELTAGEGNTGMYTDFLQNIPEARVASRILVHESLLTPDYGGKSTTYIMQVDDYQVMKQLQNHVRELVSVAVFDDWADYLWQAGKIAKLVRNTRCGGGLTILAIDLDIDAWTRLITGGLSEKVIFLPENAKIPV